MYINELAVGSSITVAADTGAQKVEFETKVIPLEKKQAAKIGIRDPFIAVEMIQHEGKAIGFSSDIPYQVLTMIDKMPYLWKGVSIALVSNPGSGEKIHIISCRQDGKKYNRRASFRQWVGAEGEAQINNSQIKIDVTVRDISSGGIGFVMRKLDGHPAKGQFAHIIFTDAAFDARFSLVAEIVWLKERNDGRYIVGCRLKNPSQAIERYITQKQRSAMKLGGPAQPLKKPDENTPAAGNPAGTPQPGPEENPAKTDQETPAAENTQKDTKIVF